MPYIPDHIMRWLGPGAVIVVGAIIIFGSPISQKVLCEGTTNCLVTWVGALSGWVAAAAAFITIRFLSTQIANADRNHLQTIALQAQPSLSIARAVLQNAKIIRGYIRNIEKLETLEHLNSVGHHFLSQIRDTLDEPVFDEFDAKIGTSEPALAPTRVSIRQALEAIEQWRTIRWEADMEVPEDAHWQPATDPCTFMKGRIITHLHNARYYCGDCTEAAEAFIARWDRDWR